MSTVIGIDVGYRQVKAVRDRKKIIFPSAVAPAKTFAVEAIGKIEDYHVRMKREGKAVAEEYFVGHLAEREAMNSLISQSDRIKHLDPSHDVLVATAARVLAGDNTVDHLVVGLPISYFRSQKDALEESLKKLRVRVSVDKIAENLVSFQKVSVFPQGSGALMTVKGLLKNGTVCLVDVGMKTTDLVVVRMDNGIMTPVASLCVSLEVGAEDFYDSVSQYYEVATGSAPSLLRTLEVVDRDGQVMYNRKELDLSKEIQKARMDIERSIVDRVKNALSEIWAELDDVYVSGGGANLFYTIDEAMGASKVNEPVWANAKGFLEVGKSHE